MKRSTDEGGKSFGPYMLGYSISQFSWIKRAKSSIKPTSAFDLFEKYSSVTFAQPLRPCAVKKSSQQEAQSSFRRTSATTISNLSSQSLIPAFLPTSPRTHSPQYANTWARAKRFLPLKRCRQVNYPCIPKHRLAEAGFETPFGYRGIGLHVFGSAHCIGITGG